MRRTLIRNESKQSLVLVLGLEALLIIEDKSGELFGEGVVSGPDEREDEPGTRSQFGFRFVPLLTSLHDHLLDAKVDLLNTRMQLGPLEPNVDLLARVLASGDDLEVHDDRSSLIVRQIDGRCVRDPAMDSSSSRVDPEEVLVAKLICERARTTRQAAELRVEADGLGLTSQSRIKNDCSSGDEAPAPLAHVPALAAGSDLVVIGHVNVEYELATLRDECCWTKRLLVARLQRGLKRENWSQLLLPHQL